MTLRYPVYLRLDVGWATRFDSPESVTAFVKHLHSAIASYILAEPFEKEGSHF